MNEQTTALLKREEIEGLIKSIPMGDVLPRHITPERMTRLAITALRGNATLQACSRGSILASVLNAGIMGLEVNTPAGHAYLVPFRDKQGNQQAQLLIGYKGRMDLVRRSGVAHMNPARSVHVGDEFAYEYGLEEKMTHKLGNGPRTRETLTHVYAVAQLSSGQRIFTVLTTAEVESYRKRSKAKDGNFWSDSYVEMALKTVVHRLCKWLPQSTEMALADALQGRADHGATQVHANPEVALLLAAAGVEVEPDEEPEPEPMPQPSPANEGKRMSLGKASQTPAEPQRQPGDD
jgi:recombination protein RecT